MPRIFRSAMIILTLAALIPLLLLVRARVTGSALPRTMIVFDMDNQARYETQSANAAFADGRAMRPPAPGTVARDQGAAVSPRTTGKDGSGEWLAEIPGGLDERMMARGAERYGVYCAPCHGLDGAGDGMVSRRAMKLEEGTWVLPSDLADDVVAARPPGHLYNTIAAGIRNMPTYASQIPVGDRWAITGYVLALQRARRATIDDVPADRRAELE